MPILQTAAKAMLGRSAARRLSRRIPNPAVRYLAIAAATTLVPMVAKRIRSRIEQKKLQRAAADGTMRYPARPVTG